MATQKVWLGMLAIALAFGMTVVGCDDGSTSNNNNDNSGGLAGTWGGTFGGYSATVVITSSGWTLSVPAADFADNGTYTLNGIVASLYSTKYNLNAGTAVILDSNTLSITLNSDTIFPGTYTLTRSNSSGGQGVPGNTDPKILVIQNIPASIFEYGANGFQIGVFSAGTTYAQASSGTGLVAGTQHTDPGWSYTVGTDPVNLTVLLYNVNTGSRWTGSGTYDIFAVLHGDGGHYYTLASVTITSAVTNIPWSSATEVFP